MNKLKRIFAFALALVGIISLASCSSHFDAELSLVATRDTIEVNASFEINDDIIDGKAKPHAKLYKVKDKEEKEYKDDKNLTMNGKYTAGSATFDGLESGSKYVVELYIKLDNKDNLITSKEAKTSQSGVSPDDPFKISTKEEFEQMHRDPDGYYELINDIDFEGEVIDDQFTSSNKFEGHFYGNNHKLSNFKIKSASNAGIFGYTKGAIIKDLNINNAEIPFGSGRSTANIGVLIGKAEDSVVENINIENTKLSLAGYSSAEIAVGTVVGFSENSSFKNIIVKNSDFNISQSRLYMSAGLFAGVIKGEAIKADFFVEDCIVSGKLSATMYYPSTAGSSFIGGFVGNVGANGVIKNCLAEADILITKDANSINTNKYDLAVGGFVGFNNLGTMNIEGSAAVADIKALAGLPTEEKPGEDFSTVKMAEQETYIGGFVGRAKWLFGRISDSIYLAKEKGITTSMLEAGKVKVEVEGEKEPQEVEKQLLYKGLFYGQTTNPEKITNSITPETANKDISKFSQQIQDILTKYIK